MCLDLSILLLLLLLLLLLIIIIIIIIVITVTYGWWVPAWGRGCWGWVSPWCRAWVSRPLPPPSWDGGGDEDGHAGGGRVGSGVVGVVGGGRGEGGAGPGRGGHGGDGGHRGTDGHAAAGVPGVGHQRAAGGHVVVAGAPAGTAGTAVQTGTLVASVSHSLFPSDARQSPLLAPSVRCPHNYGLRMRVCACVYC